MTRKRSREVKVDTTSYRKTYEKTFKPKRRIKSYIPFVLIGIFFLVLFFNSYFNYTSGTAFNPNGTTIGTRFFLSGPDPYYNMRTCVETIEHGYYCFVTETDPLLNYPIGHYGSARPPLFNMIAITSANILNGISGIGIVDSLGWCMLFLPAIYGALLVFPVYGIGKELFNKKVGLISAFFVAIIPIHLGSGHGSAFSLFDHDSFILLLITVIFYLFLKTLKEKDIKKSIFYAVLCGVFSGATQLTWVNAELVFVPFAVFGLIILFINIFKQYKDYDILCKLTFILGIGFFISVPYDIIRGTLFNFPFYTFVIVLGLTLVCLVLKKIDFPWIMSLPATFIFGTGILSFLYIVHLGIIDPGQYFGGPIRDAAVLIFGTGIYGTEVALTIGEAHTYGISQTVLSFGPSVYWLGLFGFILFIWKTHKEKWKSYNIFFIMTFLLYMWLAGTAGRFLNNLVPLIALFAGYVLIVLVEKIDYKKMIRNIKSIGGFRGIRKGIKFTHITGILFVSCLVVFPNTYLALDAGTPPEIDEKIFGEGFRGVYGNSLFQQMYWVDACYWLSLQDNEIEKPENRPAIISWWDYGFYISSMSEHPTVADNFQEGIPPASNFLTSQSEKEAISIFIIRLAEGTKDPPYYGEISDECKEVFRRHLEPYVIENMSKTPAEDIVNIINYPQKYAPSYDQPVAPEWGYTGLKISDWNAMYQDASDIIMTLTDEEVTLLYHDMMESTGYSIRYCGIEQRDLVSIFGVFPFLADRGAHGFATMEDDFYVTKYVDKNTGIEYTVDELQNLSDSQIREMKLDTTTQRKSGYYNSMIFALYYGPNFGNQVPNNRAPTYGLKHFVPVYVSPYVVISKYYEGAKISGTIKVGDVPYSGSVVFVLDKFGIPHDGTIVSDGNVNLVAPEGNISLGLFISGELIAETNLESPITEEEATRQIDTNKTFSFDINMSSLAVLVSNVNEQNLTLYITSRLFPSMSFTRENISNTTYFFDDLIPDIYDFVIESDLGVERYSGYRFIEPDENEYNILIGES